MGRVLLAAALAAAILAPGAASAQPSAAADVSDARCVAVLSFAVSKITDEKTKVATSMAIFYYIGKLDGRTPGEDLEAKIRQQVKSFSPDTLKAELDRCGGEFETRSGQVGVIGEHLKANPAG
jgi:hypothetical protein